MTSTRTEPLFDRALGFIVDTAGWVAALSGLALVLVVGGNVLLRYLFNSGSVAMQELEWHLVSPIALMGMAYGMRHGGHVRVDFLYERLGPRAQAIIDVFSAVLMAILGAALIWFAIPYVEQSIMMGEGSPDPGGLPYRFILKAFIPIGFGLLLIQAIAQSLISYRQIFAEHSAPAFDASNVAKQVGAGD
ncbi:C4-dicarboxylate ABC transporter permease [Thalassospira tepidiphila]|jgi:TRAP-type mannitol/chloroaromatic compound transport system permease small subunit|uniref:TRAP transporter small permease subunit n=1 Tax=Thalassospira tepidiphila TaxID=393657 RepID=UPI001BCDDD30|nr:TRAP transporter small permease subunit [Thalassospira tepidiphila]MBS8273107.1 C4-dicarboxylate ABC transporter permease [Thalassospira tepidiphila]